MSTRFRFPRKTRAFLFGLIPLLMACEKTPVPVDPGRVTLHRLNRDEYDNTVRDLLGTSQRPAQQFPSDDSGYGFDNVAQVLSVSAPHVERYLRAAESLIDEALRPDGFPLNKLLQAGDVEVRYRRRNQIFFASNSSIPIRIEVPTSANYVISTSAFGEQVPPDPAQMVIAVDGVLVKTLNVNGTESAPDQIQIEVPLTAGTHMLSFGFANDLYVPDPDPGKTKDRNLGVYWFRIHGPVGVNPENAIRRRTITCTPSTSDQNEWQRCADQILSRFARRAFRRTVSTDEVTELRALSQEAWRAGDDFLTGLRPALIAVLLSPRFLYRVEIDQNPSSLTPHRLNDFELASRLSYFLWSSMPDDELLRLAEQSVLDDDDSVLSAQVARMLDDPKAENLLHRFASQWLQLATLDGVTPDLKRFPTWNESLRSDMKQETLLFLRDFMPLLGSRNLPITRLLSEPMTYLSPTLAKHYGMDGPGPDVPWEQTTLLGTPRIGLLTQGSVLTMTSYPGRTSPVKRGKWILEQLLCSPPPPPPPGVSTDLTAMMGNGTLRQKLEAHRQKPECAGCHRLMDPLGFGLESFDAVGAFRNTDEGQPIDTKGQLPSGATFSDHTELTELVKSDPRYLRCIAMKLFTYGIGRTPVDSDETQLANIIEQLGSGEGTLRQLIFAIAKSEPFRSRRGETDSVEGVTP